MILLSLIFILLIIILSSGFRTYLKNFPGYSDSMKISIITTAKNEALLIQKFISLIAKLDYPQENFEFILVDDNSSDDTYTIAKTLIEKNENFKIIKAEEKLLPAKRGALLKGIQSSQFPYIVITDADCTPSANWLKVCAAQFERGHDFIFGAAPFYQDNNFINKLSCIENIKNQFLSFSLASLGAPYTASARTLGFLQEAFYRIGGYNNTIETMSGDDDLLLREAIKNKLRISAFYSNDSMVYSTTKMNLNDYLNQKARHTQSSIYYQIKNRVVLSAWHLLNLIMLFSPIFIFINFNLVWLFIVKMTADIIIITNVQKKFGYDFNAAEIFFYDILYEIFLLINFFNALLGKAKWK